MLHNTYTNLSSLVITLTMIEMLLFKLNKSKQINMIFFEECYALHKCNVQAPVLYMNLT